MWDLLLSLIPFGCHHRHLSQPFSLASNRKSSGSSAAWEAVPVSHSASEIYVVCLDCGKHFEYDWSRMRVVK